MNSCKNTPEIFFIFDIIFIVSSFALFFVSLLQVKYEFWSEVSGIMIDIALVLRLHSHNSNKRSLFPTDS